MRAPDLPDTPPPPAARARLLSGWGRYEPRDCRLAEPADEAELAGLLSGGGALIARGAGRAYGDAAVNEELTVSMRRFDRMLALDAERGTLAAEAGVPLGDIVRAMLPRGWFPMVTPGTQFATLGGLIAADVHGKNHHHVGSFSACVRWIDLMGPDGGVTRVSRESDPELFAATCGGMGLTGVILRAEIVLAPLESAWIEERIVATRGLEETMEAFEAGDAWPYSVAWIDCLAGGPRRGRGLLHLGRHAPRGALDAARAAQPFRAPAKRRRRVPMDAPPGLLNRWSVSAFNALHHARGSRAAARGPRLVDWETYFYPLDAIEGWNRLYGPRGFVQFQCVIPEAGARAGLARLLEATGESGAGAFLAVLKKFGAAAGGPAGLSFPAPGWTLALDLPASRRALLLADRLEAIALEHGGRFYLAKDARLPRARFEAAEPRAGAFRALREARGLGRFASAQSARLGL
jgi:FAD/FMN-containing dehydrogenase